MELAGLTQVRLAADVSMSQPQISEIVNGNYGRLPLETARSLSHFFGCSVDDMFPTSIQIRRTA